MKVLLLFTMFFCLTGFLMADCWSDEDCPCHKYGDTNCDGYITSLDIQMIIHVWGIGYDRCADVSEDGYITSLDVQAVLAYWGSSIYCDEGGVHIFD